MLLPALIKKLKGLSASLKKTEKHMKILLTGFEPFNKAKINPSQILVERMPTELCGAEIIKLSSVPVVFYEAGEYVLKAVKEHRPDAVLCLGQAGGRAAISIERLAINLIDASIADNAGNKPTDKPIFSDGENAYFSSLPIKSICESMKSRGINAAISNSAGLFVCNQLMYTLLYYAAKEKIPMLSGFIHIPYLNEQVTEASSPSISLSEAEEAIKTALLSIIAELNRRQSL